MKLGLSEILENASKLKTKEEKIKYLRDNYSLPLGILLKMTYDSKLKWALPEGVPPYRESPITDNESMLPNEVRRLYLFHEGSNTNLTDSKRQHLFVGLLESLDRNDAKFLLGVKEKKLPYEGITRSLIEEAYPGLLVYPYPMDPEPEVVQEEPPQKKEPKTVVRKPLSEEHKMKLKEAAKERWSKKKASNG